MNKLDFSKDAVDSLLEKLPSNDVSIPENELELLDIVKKVAQVPRILIDVLLLVHDLNANVHFS